MTSTQVTKAPTSSPNKVSENNLASKLNELKESNKSQTSSTPVSQPSSSGSEITRTVHEKITAPVAKVESQNSEGAGGTLPSQPIKLSDILKGLEKLGKNKGTGNGDSALEKAILLTASFEGSGYVNVTGNFDGAGLSIGIFQWNIGQGTLQPMLKQFFDNNPDLAKQIFGNNYQSVVNMLGASKSAQMDWARSINNGKKLQTEWYNQFTALCKTSQFQQIQKGAMKEYTNQAYNIANTYGLKSERGLALALDIAVQNWDVSATSRANIKNSIKNGATEQQILQLLAQAAVDKADSAYKADVRSRKFTIVNGTGTVHGANYNLEKDYGITDA